jgi:hypothetical protein
LNPRFFLYEKAKKGLERKGTHRRFLPFLPENSRISAREINFFEPQKKVFYFHRKKVFLPQKKHSFVPHRIKVALPHRKLTLCPLYIKEKGESPKGNARKGLSDQPPLST